MTGRYEGRVERQNEYFIPGEGISREVIQADICRYLGNDALVRPGTHNNRPGFFIRAYRNLTSEMITDLKADSARWEADVSRRAALGQSRGNYIQDVNVSHPPNTAPPSYAPSAVHESRQSQGASPTPFTAAPAQQYMDPYSQSPYSGSQNPPYTTPSSYTGPSHSPYASGTTPYPPPQVSYSGSNQPVVTAADMHGQTYTYSPGYYDNGRGNPRYPGPAYDAEQDYSPVTSGMAYPTTTAPDPRIGMEPRYTPEYERRPQASRDNPHRRR
ncbi:uncharacterized protein N7515_000891 [Penicillium bovifimosum]|uniref:Transcription factor RfeG n=1 Tax=Penicillium bovifimosum TaxID=126998 RepID=A0A9W9HJ35_9EURO|nr:uncharacterized protein N7515_000891 [Penicillium bovifimosum]KAJ5146327.1 hypothetical protein N7515_000891 [Penicillium bovifimosum]